MCPSSWLIYVPGPLAHLYKCGTYVVWHIYGVEKYISLLLIYEKKKESVGHYKKNYDE